MITQGDPTPGEWTTVDGDKIFDAIFQQIGIKAGQTDPLTLKGKSGFLEPVDNSMVLNAGGTRATLDFSSR
jgi:hypothetical protein